MQVHTYAPVVGRALIGFLFVVTGIFSAIGIDGTAGMIASVGFPASLALAYLVVAVKIGGGAALMIGWQVRYAALALIGFILLATIFFHLSFPGEMVNFLKNMAIIGGLLLVIGANRDDTNA